MSSRMIGPIGVVLFLILCAWCIIHTAPRIQSDLESRSATALLAARLPLDEVVFRGRDATVTRSLASPEHVERALAVLREVRGIRTITVASPSSSGNER